MVMRFTDDVVKNVRASDATWKPLIERLSLQEMQELVATIGYYMTASRFLENFDVDIESDADPKVSPLKGPLIQ
jgi:4-carboxymuconolactone decarboxylase